LNIKDKTLTLHYGIQIIIIAVYGDDIKTNIKTRHKVELIVFYKYNAGNHYNYRGLDPYQDIPRWIISSKKHNKLHIP